MGRRNDSLCPVCETGQLVPYTDQETFDYKGNKFSLDEMEFARCEHCGTELVTPEQSRRNGYRIRDYHRKLDGLLTGSEIRTIRKQLGLNQLQAAELFGGGPNSFSKYERGEVIQSVAMDRLLRVAGESPDLTLALLRVSGLSKVPESKRLVVCDYGTPCDLDVVELEFTQGAKVTESRRKVREVEKTAWVDEPQLKVANG